MSRIGSGLAGVGSVQGAPILGTSGQAFVAGANPVNTRRVCDPLSSGNTGVNTSTWTDVNVRQGKTVAQTPTRFRFRIRNSNVVTNTNPACTITTTGIAIGTPSIPFGGAWAGVFASAPTQVFGVVTQDVGTTELVTPWISNTGANQLIKARVPFGFSLGFTCATPANLGNSFGMVGLVGAASSGTAFSSAFAATNPGGAMTTPMAALDIRLEYEYVGSNPIGLYLGTSITNGTNGIFGGAFGTNGIDNGWPNMVGLRVGHAISNDGINGAALPTFTAGAGSNAWTRVLDPNGTTWPGGCTPDYAIIDIGVNDILLAATAGLATFKGNMATIISTLNSLGIYNIYVNTVPPATMDGHAFSLLSSSNGLLGTALTAGAGKTAVAVQNPGGTAGPPLVGINSTSSTPGSYPGPTAAWQGFSFWIGTAALGNQEGPFACTAAAYGGSSPFALALTATAFTLANAHAVGDAVLGASEGYRQLINQWIRSGVTGTSGTVDFSTVSTTQVGLTEQLNPKYYANNNNGPHPNDPGMYEAWAQLFTISLVGV